MDKKTYVVIRRYGYYINAIPNQEEVLAGWVRNNVSEMPARSFAQQARILEKKGFSFNTVTAKHLPYVKPYKKSH